MIIPQTCQTWHYPKSMYANFENDRQVTTQTAWQPDRHKNRPRHPADFVTFLASLSHVWGERRESAAKRARRAYSKMAANGSVDEQSAAGELDDNSDKIVLNNVNTPLIECVCDTFDVKDTVDDQRHPDELASRLAATGASWITTNHNKSKMIASSAAPLTFCSQDDPRRTLRIDRSGSTERLVCFCYPLVFLFINAFCSLRAKSADLCSAYSTRIAVFVSPPEPLRREKISATSPCYFFILCYPNKDLKQYISPFLCIRQSSFQFSICLRSICFATPLPHWDFFFPHSFPFFS